MNAQEWSGLNEKQRLERLRKWHMDGQLYEGYHEVATDAANRLQQALLNVPEVLSVTVEQDGTRMLPFNVDNQTESHEFRDFSLIVNTEIGFDVEEVLGVSTYCGYVVLQRTVGKRREKYQSDWRMLNRELLKMPECEFSRWMEIWDDGLAGLSPYVFHQGVVKLFCQLMAKKWITMGSKEPLVVVQQSIDGILNKFVVLDDWKSLNLAKSNLDWTLMRDELDKLRMRSSRQP